MQSWHTSSNCVLLTAACFPSCTATCSAFSMVVSTQPAKHKQHTRKLDQTCSGGSVLHCHGQGSSTSTGQGCSLLGQRSSALSKHRLPAALSVVHLHAILVRLAARHVPNEGACFMTSDNFGPVCPVVSISGDIGKYSARPLSRAGQGIVHQKSIAGKRRFVDYMNAQAHTTPQE